MYLSEAITEIQSEYEKLVDRQAVLLKKKFDIEVNITIIRLLFRKDDLTLPELESYMFQQDVEYFELEKLDIEILRTHTLLQLLETKLHNL